MEHPQLNPSNFATHEFIFLYLDDIFALSKMCFQLIASQELEDIHSEYKMILKQNNVRHQIICGIESDGNLLGCINPIYRHGKPLKFQLNSRNMILALVDGQSQSNVQFRNFPDIYNVKSFSVKPGVRFKEEKFELIPLECSQDRNVHFTFRQCIEFNRVDTYSSLYKHLIMPQAASHHQHPNLSTTFNVSNAIQVQQSSNGSVYCFDDLMNSLP